MSIFLLSLLACGPKHETAFMDAPAEKLADAEQGAEAGNIDPFVVPDEPPPVSAVARLESKGVMGGAVAFTQSADDVKVSVNLTGAEQGPHVLRIYKGKSCNFSDSADNSTTSMEDLTTVTADANGRAHVDLTLEEYNVAPGEEGLLGMAVVVDDGKACGVVASVK